MSLVEVTRDSPVRDDVAVRAAGGVEWLAKSTMSAVQPGTRLLDSDGACTEQLQAYLKENQNTTAAESTPGPRLDVH